VPRENCNEKSATYVTFRWLLSTLIALAVAMGTAGAWAYGTLSADVDDVDDRLGKRLIRIEDKLDRLIERNAGG